MLPDSTEQTPLPAAASPSSCGAVTESAPLGASTTTASLPQVERAPAASPPLCTPDFCSMVSATAALPLIAGLSSTAGPSMACALGADASTAASPERSGSA
eukprot:scaffold55710_cov25-Tisochrysis_lutea.AAC.3